MEEARLGFGMVLMFGWFVVAALAQSQDTASSTRQNVSMKPDTNPAHRNSRGSSDIPKIAFEKYRLSNGLEVILAQDHRLPVVAANIWYHVGPANEEAGRTGFAHLFEHMMFQGSKHVARGLGDMLLERAGASNMNATTDFDRTNYFETLPSNQLELALWIESDRMGYLLEQLDQASLSNQQDVVRNERRQTTENRPYGIVEEALFHQLFPASHPYYADVIGSHQDIQAAKLEDVRKFFRSYYVPNNASLAIAGDFDEAQAKKLVSKYFGTLRRGAPVPKTHVQIPQINSERRVVIKDRVELDRVDMAWITPSIFQPGDAEASLAARVLGGGKSSRLYKKLVYEKQIAQNVSAQSQGLSLGSVFQLQATARSGHTPAELEAAINEELERFRREGPTETELDGARNFIESRLLTRLETLNGLADRLNYYNHYLGKPDFLAQDIERYRRVTTAQVKAFAQEQLKQGARVVVECFPGTPDLGPDVPAPTAGQGSVGAGIESVNADEPWRQQVPKAGVAHALHLPVPQTFQLPNGLTVIFTERQGVPLVAARLVVSTGSGANPIDEPGLAAFTAGMLDRGTSSRSALEISDEAERLGATLDTDSSMDATFVSLRSLKRNLTAALNLLADVALHPSFPPEEITRERASRLTGLLQQKANAALVADQVASRVLYGTRNPYGYPEIGTEAALKKTDRNDMLTFWKKSFVPNNAALVVAGDITLAELKALVEKNFEAWQPGAPTSGSPTDGPSVRVGISGSPFPLAGTASAAEETQAVSGALAVPADRVVQVDKPGAGQTQLRVGMIGVARTTPDYPALEIMNASLGGLFSSRINQNLREEKGFTYGARSSFLYRRSPGPFLVRAGVRTDATAASVTEIFKEIRRMGEGLLSPEELILAKDSQVLSLPGRFETTAQMVASFSNIFIYDLGMDYYSKLPLALSSIDSAAVRDVARKYLVPAKMIVVAVGDRARIAPGLAELSLGPVELRNPDGSVMK